MRHRWIALVFGVLVGCSDRSAGGDVLVRDSAGIRIVESTSPQWADSSGWRVSPTPLLDLDEAGDGPAYEFQDIRGVLRLPNGRVVVLDNKSDEVRLYSSDGSHLRSMGRDGDGPGEFRSPVSISLFRGDSLVVWDARLRRLTVLDSELRLGRVSLFPISGPWIFQMDWLEDSTFVAGLYNYGSSNDLGQGYYRIPIQLTRFSFGTDRFDTVAHLAGFEGFTFERGDAPTPFQKISQVAVSQGVIVAGDSGLMELLVYGTSGTLESIIRVPNYDLSISRSDIDLELGPWLAPEAPRFIRDAVKRMPIPDTKAAFRRLLLDTELHVWALRYQTRSERDGPQLWEVFDSGGRWLGPVQTPARFNLLSVGEDYVAGVYRDELDVQHPVILPLMH